VAVLATTVYVTAGSTGVISDELVGWYLSDDPEDEKVS
jgi:hypothetical protein